MVQIPRRYRYIVRGGLLVTILLVSQVVFAQNVLNTLKSTEDLASEYYENHNYQKALELYNHLVTSGRASLPAILRLGRLNFYFKNYNSTVKRMEQYQLKDPLPQEDLLMYADALTSTGRYDMATDAYEEYMQKFETNDWLTMKVWRLNNLAHLYEDSLVYSIAPVSANTKYSEFPAAYYNDGLLLISDRERSGRFKKYVADQTGRETYALYYTQDLWPFDVGYATPEVERSFLIKKGPYHVSGMSFLPDREKFIYAKNVRNGEGDKERKLQLFIKNVESGGESRYLNINDKSFSFKSPSISANGQELYYAADLPEGYGELDIYKSVLIDGEWSAPINLGNLINTPGNESFPFIHNNEELYYSSDGHPGFGGYDLFKVDVTLKEAEPENLGYPVNSTADDFSLILNARGDRGHFASNRENKGLDDDIYAVEIDLQEYPLTISGVLKFKNLDSEPVLLPETKYEVVDNQNQNVVFASRSNKHGGFSIEIPYSSQFFLRVHMGGLEPLVVSFEIPKNKDKRVNHEIVVVSNTFLPVQQTDNNR